MSERNSFNQWYMNMILEKSANRFCSNEYESCFDVCKFCNNGLASPRASTATIWVCGSAQKLLPWKKVYRVEIIYNLRVSHLHFFKLFHW